MTQLRIANLFLIASSIFVSLAALGYAQNAYAQESSPQVSEEVSRALSLYKAGDIRSAVNVLRERVKAKADDADAWHYLGVISMKSGDLKSAVQSFQMAVKLRPNFAMSHTGLAYAFLSSNNHKDAKREAEQVLKLNKQSDEAHYIISDIALKEGDYRKALDEADAALEIEPRFKAAMDVKQKALFVVFMSAVYPFREETQASGKKAIMALQIMTGFCCIDLNQSNIQVGDALQSRRLGEAAEVFEKSIKRTPNFPEAAGWRETLESLKFWRDYFDPEQHAGSGTSKQFDPKSVTTSARITSKPAPRFSKEDIKGLEQAKVVLRALITEDGEVKHIMVMRSLGYELTRRAIEVARQARFEPAKRDGVPVPVITLIEYDFKEMAAANK
jgi:TonB family protein